MKFDGRAYAQEIYEELKNEVTMLKEQGITPRMAVILVGQNPNSLSYIKQKKTWGDFIGAEIVVHQFEETITEAELLHIIQHFNQDPTIHGIIVQLPLPPHLDEKKLVNAVTLEKDIDGFHTGSSFRVPVAQAVLSILEQIHPESFTTWLQAQNIVVLGKGKTAGHPIIELLQTLGLHPAIIDHLTPNPEVRIREADIVISCVGKVILHPDMVKKQAILIGVGLHQKEDGKLQGDFLEEEMDSYVSAYTPTPRGVGPVNVACLLRNLIRSTKNLASQK